LEVTKMNKIFIAILCLLMVVPGVLAVGSMTRTMPATATPGQTFSVVYTVSGVSGNYIVSVSDLVTGNCVPNGQNQFFIAANFATKGSETLTYTAPASGSCVFHGDYKFGEDAVVGLTDKTITVSGGGCTSTGCDAWSICSNGQQSRICHDSCGNAEPETQACTPPDPCAGLTVCADGICRTSCTGICATGTYLCSDGTCKTNCLPPVNCTSSQTCGNWGVCIALGTSFVQSRYCTDVCGNTWQEPKTVSAADCAPNSCPTGQGKCTDGTCSTSCGNNGGGGDIMAWLTQETILNGIANWMVLVGGFIILMLLMKMIK
jgi:hypothetical protein